MIEFLWPYAVDYVHVPYFHKTVKQFEEQQERDRLKYKLCQENDVKLVLIPYKFDHRNTMKFSNFIVDQLICMGYQVETETIINIIDDKK